MGLGFLLNRNEVSGPVEWIKISLLHQFGPRLFRVIMLRNLETANVETYQA